jgi:phosphoribosylformylglycinamidine (FGAM) synthase PurS component
VTEIEVLVRLAASDPWSFTVLDTLRRRFGLAEVGGVERIKSWLLTFAGKSREQALETVEDLMQATALLANPNRDLWFVRGSPDSDVPQSIWTRPDGISDVWVIRVADRDDIVGRSMAGILRTRLSIRAIKEVRYSTVWVLEMTRPRPDPSSLAHQIATARSWRKGLLANPHCQTAEVCRAEEYLCGTGGYK